MKNRLIQLLTALKLLDSTGVLNLSATLLLAIVLKAIVLPQIEVTLVALAFLLLANYNLKRLFKFLSDKNQTSDKQKLEKLEKEVQSLISIQSMNNLRR